MTKVLFAPDLNLSLMTNVLSVRQLTKKGFHVDIDDKKCEINHRGKQIAVADVKGELYVLLQPKSNKVCAVFQHNDQCIHTLHRKMGHRGPKAVRKMISNDGSIEGLEIVECGIKEVCDVCMRGKMTRLPFPKKSSSESLATMNLIDTDVCGPMHTQTPSGKRYIVTLIDDYSGFTIINKLLAHKSEVEITLRKFVEFCKTNFGSKPKMIRSDRGG